MGSPRLERGAGHSLAIKLASCYPCEQANPPKFYFERMKYLGSRWEWLALPGKHFLPIQSMFSMQSVTNACFRLPRRPPITQSIVARRPPVLSLPPCSFLPPHSSVQKIQSTLPRTLTAGLYWHFHIVDNPIEPFSPATDYSISYSKYLGLVWVGVILGHLGTCLIWSKEVRQKQGGYYLRKADLI